jgi:hypothetical protein
MLSTEAITSGLQRFEEATRSYRANEPNSTQAILDAARAILSAGGQERDKLPAPSVSRDEKPSDFLQRVMWVEVSDTQIDGTISIVSSIADNIFPSVFHWRAKRPLTLKLADRSYPLHWIRALALAKFMSLPQIH